jgi:intracellular sulfur oxidation DsrE/DsrF family protein
MNTKLLTLLCLTLAWLSPTPSSAEADDDVHRIIIQVDVKDPGTMNLALNNAANINRYYMDQGEEAEIEIVTFGPGLIMLRSDSSPVKDRIASFAQNYDNIHFKACANTIRNMERKSGKKVHLLEQAEIVPSGVIQIISRQEAGWSYIRP